MSGPVTPARPSPLAWLLVWPIRFYQRFVSRYTPATCRYYPCCSSYAIAALRTHGAAKGLLLTALRLLRCNPWSSGGIDHVPPRGRWRPPADGAQHGAHQAEQPGDEPGAPRLPERSDAADRSDTDLSCNAQPSARAPIAGRAAA